MKHKARWGGLCQQLSPTSTHLLHPHWCTLYAVQDVYSINTAQFTSFVFCRLHWSHRTTRSGGREGRREGGATINNRPWSQEQKTFISFLVLLLSDIRMSYYDYVALISWHWSQQSMYYYNLIRLNSFRLPCHFCPDLIHIFLSWPEASILIFPVPTFFCTAFDCFTRKRKQFTLHIAQGQLSSKIWYTYWTASVNNTFCIPPYCSRRSALILGFIH